MAKKTKAKMVAVDGNLVKKSGTKRVPAAKPPKILWREWLPDEDSEPSFDDLVKLVKTAQKNPTAVLMIGKDFEADDHMVLVSQKVSSKKLTALIDEDIKPLL